MSLVGRWAFVASFVILSNGLGLGPVAFAQPATDGDATTAPSEGEDEDAAQLPSNEGEDVAPPPSNEGEDGSAPAATQEGEGEDAGGAAATHEGEGEDAGAAATHEGEGEDAGTAAPEEPAPDPSPSSEATPPAHEGHQAGGLHDGKPPHGDVPIDELMPDAQDMQPVDDDGDGIIEEAEQPIAFDVPNNLSGAPYLAKLKELIAKTRDKIITKMITKTTVKQSKSMGLIMWIMLGLAGAGIFLLLTPLFLKKKYPGKEALLRKGSMLAAGAWISTMLVFTGAMFLLRTAKNETALIASPPLAIANSAFDAAIENVDFLAEDAQVILEAPIAALGAGSQEGMLEAVLENVSQFRNDLGVFMAVAKFFKSLNWLFAAFGLVLVILAVVLFMLSQKQVLGDILRLPARAAAGDAGSFASVYTDMQKRTVREVMALIATIGFLVVMALISGLVLYVVVAPAVFGLFDYLIANIYYILGQPGASKAVVYVSLFGLGLFLGLIIVFVLMANAFFLGKVQKVLQQKFRHQIPMSNYKTFWQWGPLSALWILALCVIFVFVAKAIIGAISNLEGATEISWTGFLLTGPLILVLGLPLFMWLGQGFRAMKFLRKFNHLQGSPEEAKATGKV